MTRCTALLALWLAVLGPGWTEQTASLVSGGSITVPNGYQKAENKPEHQDWTNRETGRSIRFSWSKVKDLQKTMESDIAFAKKRKNVVRLEKLPYPGFLFMPKPGGRFYGSSIRFQVYGPSGVHKIHFLNPRKTEIKAFEKQVKRVARSFKHSH